MTTGVISVDDTTYVLLASTDALVQNTSAYPVRIVFAASLPSVGSVGSVLEAGGAIQKVGDFPAGSIYGRSDLANRTCSVAVSGI